MYKHILVCTDGSEVARKGVDQGLALARSLGARATIITATDHYPFDMSAGVSSWAPSQADIDNFDQAQADTAQKTLDAARSEASRIGVEAAAVHVANARPADAIIETAAAKGCDLIVMASHGRRGLRKMLLGSQAQEVVSQSQIPVLVVR